MINLSHLLPRDLIEAASVAVFQRGPDIYSSATTHSRWAAHCAAPRGQQRGQLSQNTSSPPGTGPEHPQHRGHPAGTGPAPAARPLCSRGRPRSAPPAPHPPVLGACRELTRAGRCSERTGIAGVLRSFSFFLTFIYLF